MDETEILVEKTEIDPEGVVFPFEGLEDAPMPSATAPDGTVTVAAAAQDQDQVSTLPFGPYVPDDRFRPYNRVVVDRDDTIATIVIMQPAKVQEPEDPSRNFLDKFAGPAIAGPLMTGSRNDNKIVRLDELGPDFYGIFKNFSLMDTVENSMEAVKVTLNFGMGWTAYFFGQQPKVFNFSGAFIDAANYPFYEQFMRAYQTYFCGTEIARRGFRFYIAYDGKVVSGYMLNINTTSSSSDRTLKRFGFQVLIDGERFFRTNMAPYDGDYGAMTNLDLIK